MLSVQRKHSSSKKHTTLNKLYHNLVAIITVKLLTTLKAEKSL